MVVQQIEMMRRRARRSAPIIRDPTAREVGVDVARVHFATVTHERQEFHRLPGAAAGEAPDHAARVHQRLDARRHEAVVDEDVFLDVERGVAPLQIAAR